MQHTQCYIKDYPRPQFVRKEWSNLNGDWDFAFDDEDRGEREGWFDAGFRQMRGFTRRSRAESRSGWRSRTDAGT